MTGWLRRTLTRRQFIGASAVSAVALAAACGDDGHGGQAVGGGASPTAPRTAPADGVTPAASPTQAQTPTPACGDDDEPTLEQTEGPFFTPDSPERASLLEPGMAGERLVVSGFVLTTGCRPVAGALLDFWQADDAGEYDNEGYRLRGHQFAGEDGAFRLETIVPGLYPGRTRHIHVKAQAPGQPVLTTQLCFPDEPANEADGIFSQALLMDVQDAAQGKTATFTFALDVA